ncbi:hypothetical protein AB0H76_15740 [Nocardia sp. NPDC050712]|uniref:hypothetical protein n=1 Tax=Nocardia sp. NPDC050712 TaxID=3155518 RepID=UPI0033D60504
MPLVVLRTQNYAMPPLRLDEPLIKAFSRSPKGSQGSELELKQPTGVAGSVDAWAAATGASISPPARTAAASDGFIATSFFNVSGCPKRPEQRRLHYATASTVDAKAKAKDWITQSLSQVLALLVAATDCAEIRDKDLEVQQHKAFRPAASTLDSG